MYARRGMCATLLTSAAIIGCTEVSTDPQLPLSLQFDSLPALAVVVGDTMRGGDLLPARIPVRVFNSSGGTVNDSAVRLIGIDTVSVTAFSMIGGLRLVGKTENAAVRIVAQAGSLQSQTQTFAVVPRPTGIGIGSNEVDSIIYNRADTATRYRDVKVAVFRQAAPESTAVFLNGLRVRFRIVSVTDSILDSVRLVSLSSGKNATSALVSSNVASLRLKAYPKSGARGKGLVTLEASHRSLGVEIPRSPFRFTVALVPVTP
jgi:hypothetical protein